ncbi:LysR family transcriptional regulator [Paraburkholderia sp. A1RI_3L]|uniref:LysR family transcriptional regulator n=1 Tax=Paraburkholderia TaxID=1822464 RepID=UPI0018F652DB|nr:LysR family transcriptional regulator [Paraburkholderia kururiensis]
MRITYRQIEIFRALMAAGSVTKAAEMLFTSQPTVSRELARLEQVIGLELFERVQGRLRPSLPGLTLFDEIKRSYVGIERINATAASLREFQGGRLSVLALPAFAHSLLPGACRRFAVAHPGAGVSISTQESPVLEEWLTGQLYDIGLTEHDSAPAGTSLTRLLEVNEVCVLPAGHPLLARQFIELEDLAQQSFISLSPTDPYRIQLDSDCAAKGIERRIVVETPSAVSLCGLVRKGVGVGIVNPLTALDFEGNELHIRPLRDTYTFRVSLVKPIHRPLNPAVAAFSLAVQREAEVIQSILDAKLGSRGETV